MSEYLLWTESADGLLLLLLLQPTSIRQVVFIWGTFELGGKAHVSRKSIRGFFCVLKQIMLLNHHSHDRFHRPHSANVRVYEPRLQLAPWNGDEELIPWQTLESIKQSLDRNGSSLFDPAPTSPSRSEKKSKVMWKADTTFGKVACRCVGISVSNGWKQKGKKKDVWGGA